MLTNDKLHNIVDAKITADRQHCLRLSFLDRHGNEDHLAPGQDPIETLQKVADILRARADHLDSLAHALEDYGIDRINDAVLVVNRLPNRATPEDKHIAAIFGFGP